MNESMSNKEQFETHANNLGKLVGNLQTLEMGARLAIVRLDQRSANQVETQLPQVKAGDIVELNAFTNGDDLTQTLEKYNKRSPLDCRIDVASIVRLRDAIGHGRAFGFGSMKHLRLLKFSRKKDTNGKVIVELAEDMTNEWFSKNISMLSQAIEKVRRALDYEKREFV
jgi:hypothetical protein